MLFRSHVVGSLLVLLFVAGAVNMYLRSVEATKQAKTVCDSIKVGDDSKTALRVLNASGGHVSSSSTDASVQFLGFGAQWLTCSVKFSNGKVASKETSSDD